MSKELEALAKIKDKLEIWDCSEESNWEEYSTGYYECEEELNIIEKSLKALEIIKEKQVEVMGLINSINLNFDYNKIFNLHPQLTQEEYELLKEVLGNE